MKMLRWWNCQSFEISGNFNENSFVATNASKTKTKSRVKCEKITQIYLRC